MTAPIHKPSRSEAEADVDGPSRSSFSDSAPAAEVRRLKPSRSEPEEELVAAVYAGDHAPELQKLQQLNSLGKEVTSRAYNHLRAPVPSIYCIFVMELYHFILLSIWYPVEGRTALGRPLCSKGAAACKAGIRDFARKRVL